MAHSSASSPVAASIMTAGVVVAVATVMVTMAGLMVAVVRLMRTAVRMRTASVEQPPSRAAIGRARKLRISAPLPLGADNRADNDGDDGGDSNRKNDDQCLH